MRHSGVHAAADRILGDADARCERAQLERMLAPIRVGADRPDHRGRDPRQVRLQLQHLVGRREPDDGPAGPVVHPLVGEHAAMIDAERIDDLGQIGLLDVAPVPPAVPASPSAVPAPSAVADAPRR